TLFLKIVLLIFAIVCIVYGIGYFIFPDFFVNLSGGEPVFHGWLRWSGGILIALGIGAIMIFQKPKNQGIFVTTIAIGTLLTGLALLYTWITLEVDSKVWFTALPTIIVLVLSGLLWWTRRQAKDILKSVEE
ncbi:hypothetical protein ACFLSA_03170, partial [Bacteroidota bacterium]